MKTAYCFALLYLDIAVSAIPTFYGQKDDLTNQPVGKREAWPCKDMKSTGWSKMALSKPNAEAVINSMFKIVKPPCNHHLAVKDVKVPDITQKPDDGQIISKHKGALKNLPRRNVTARQPESGKPPHLMAAAMHNKATTLGNQVKEEERKVGAFTNIINSKIATPRLAHILPLWIPQRKYFNVRRDENLILRNQKSNSLHKDRQLNSNLQFNVLHSPKDFLNGVNFNIDKFSVPSFWNKLPFNSNVEVKKLNDKMKRQARASDKEAKKKFFMSKKELHNSGGKYRKDQAVTPYALFYRVPENSDSKGVELLKYLNEPSTAIYGPYVPLLRGDDDANEHANQKKMSKIKDIYKS